MIKKNKTKKTEHTNAEQTVENKTINAEVENCNNHEECNMQDEAQQEEETTSELAEAREKIAILEDKYLRQVAEFDNYRKRTLKEKADIIKNGGERIIEAILPIIDDLERALENMKKSKDTDAFGEGIELIYNKFINILKQNGLQKIETTDKTLDTDYHEAIALIPTGDEKMKGKILDCVQTGYLLNDKVIRHAKVAIGE